MKKPPGADTPDGQPKPKRRNLMTNTTAPNEAKVELGSPSVSFDGRTFTIPQLVEAVRSLTEKNATPNQHDATRAQIEALNAITAYYAAMTERVRVRANRTDRMEFARGGAIPPMEKQPVAEALENLNTSGAQHISNPEFARGGVIYPTKVEMINTKRGPVSAAITFAWSPDEPHHLSRNEVLELRDQLSQFLLDSAKQLSPEVKA